jgi:tetratricopeptide (TPR) repeat protein
MPSYQYAFQIGILWCSFLASPWLMAQQENPSDFIKIAEQYLQRQDEDGALEAYLLALDQNPENIQALINASYYSSRVGNRKSRDEQIKLFQQALKWAHQAIELQPESAEAHLVLSIALGRIALVAPARERMKYSLQIEVEAERALQLNPNLAGAMHIMGLWHYRMANLSAAEMEAANELYGQIPAEVSMEKALDYLEKAVAAQPDFVLYRYDLARIYWQAKQIPEAREQLQFLLELPDSTVDDVPLKLKAREMLARP